MGQKGKSKQGTFQAEIPLQRDLKYNQYKDNKIQFFKRELEEREGKIINKPVQT